MSRSSNTGDWRQERKPRTSSERVDDRTARRVWGTILVISLLAAFGYYLFQPSAEPSTLHVVRLTVTGYKRLAAPQLPFLAGDAKQLSRLKSVAENLNYQDASDSIDWHNFKDVGEQSQRKRVGDKDILLVYASALTIAENARDAGIVLLRDAYNPGSLNGSPVDEASQMPLRTLLKEISASPAQHKVLILDPGWFPADLVHGRIRNQFRELLPGVMGEQKDQHLWLVALNADGRPSLVSMSEGCTQAARLISDALRKCAGDGRFSLTEFVRRLQTECGAALYQGGNIKIVEAFPASSGSTSFELELKPGKAGTEEGMPSEGSPAVTGKSEKSSASSPPSTAGTDVAAALRNNRLDLPLLLELWRIRDDLERRIEIPRDSSTPATSIRWTPIDTDPMLWRKLNMQLLAYEYEFLNGHMTTQSRERSGTKLGDDLKDSKIVLLAIRDILNGKEPDQSSPEATVETALRDRVKEFLLKRKPESQSTVAGRQAEQIRKLQRLTDSIWTASCLTEFLAISAGNDLPGQQRDRWHAALDGIWRNLNAISFPLLVREELDEELLTTANVTHQALITEVDSLRKNLETMAGSSQLDLQQIQVLLATPILRAETRQALLQKALDDSGRRSSGNSPIGNSISALALTNTYDLLTKWGNAGFSSCWSKTNRVASSQEFARNLQDYLTSPEAQLKECLDSQGPRRYWLSLLADPRGMEGNVPKLPGFPWTIKATNSVDNQISKNQTTNSQNTNTGTTAGSATGTTPVVDPPKPARVQIHVEPQLTSFEGAMSGLELKSPRAAIVDKPGKVLRNGKPLERAIVTTLRTIAHPAFDSKFELSASLERDGSLPADRTVLSRALLVRPKSPAGSINEILRKPVWKDVLGERQLDRFVKRYLSGTLRPNAEVFETIAVTKEFKLSTTPVPIPFEAPVAPTGAAAGSPTAVAAPQPGINPDISLGLACIVVESANPEQPWICAMDVQPREPSEYLTLLPPKLSAEGKALFRVKLNWLLPQTLPIPLELQANRKLRSGTLSQEEWLGESDASLDFAWETAPTSTRPVNQSPLEFRLTADGFPRAWTLRLGNQQFENASFRNRVRIGKVWTVTGAQAGPEFVRDEVLWQHIPDDKKTSDQLLTNSTFGFGKPADKLNVQLLIDSIGENFLPGREDCVLVELHDDSELSQSQNGELSRVGPQKRVYAKLFTKNELKSSIGGQLVCSSSVREPEVQFDIKNTRKKLIVRAMMEINGKPQGDPETVKFVISDKKPTVNFNRELYEVDVGSSVSGTVGIQSEVGIAKSVIALRKAPAAKFEGDDWVEFSAPNFALDTKMLKPGAYRLQCWIRDRNGNENEVTVARVFLREPPLPEHPPVVPGGDGEGNKKKPQPADVPPGVIKVALTLEGDPAGSTLDMKITLEPKVSKAIVKQMGHRFTISGVPAGQYTIKAFASGRKDYQGTAMGVQPVAPDKAAEAEPTEIPLTPVSAGDPK